MRFRAIIWALAAASSFAAACGICVDDKVAATYDYAVMQRAEARGDVVVFCEIAGRVDGPRLQAGARRLDGVDAASVRISQQPPGISFALDRKQAPAKAAAALERQLHGVRITILKVIDASSKS